MKIIDSKGKLFGKINIIDLLVILALVILGFSLVFKASSDIQKNLKTDTVIEYTVEVNSVRQPTVDAINKNFEGLIEYDTEKSLGNIVNIEVSKAEELLKLVDGTYKKVELEDKYDIVLTIKADGTETNDSYYTRDGKALATGDVLSIYNDYVLCSGMITNIKTVSE